MKNKTILELTDDYAKVYFKGSDPSESAPVEYRHITTLNIATKDTP